MEDNFRPASQLTLAELAERKARRKRYTILPQKRRKKNQPQPPPAAAAGRGVFEVDEAVLWGDVLTQAKIAPSSEDANKFTKLLASPPSLQVLK